jgi:hypothetical protein
VLPKAPTTFNDKLSVLFTKHVTPLLPSPDSVERLHKTLMSYVRQGARVFPIRNRVQSERCCTIRTHGGDQIIWTDNSPPWAIHSLLLQGQFLDQPSFADWLEKTMPIEFKVAHASKQDAINKARYHVAHLFDVQAGRDNSEPEGWSRREVEIRFLRNIHPCNAFYVPIPKWHSYGGDPAVKAFFYKRYSDRYRKCWDEFLEAVAGSVLGHADPDPVYVYGESDWRRKSGKSRRFKLTRGSTERTTGQIRAIVAILKADGRGQWSLAEISALMSKGAAVGDLITSKRPRITRNRTCRQGVGPVQDLRIGAGIGVEI